MERQAEPIVGVGISDNELERRWKAVRQAMKEAGLDFLLLQNGGGVRWFTGAPLARERTGASVPCTVIFPRDDAMTLISSGPRPVAPPAPLESVERGVKKRLSAPIKLSLVYSTIFDAELVVSELAPYKNCRIGLVGTGLINAPFYKYVTSHLNTAKFEDACDIVDPIIAVKSDEELNLIRETCKMQDELWEYALTCVQPGRREYEVCVDLLHKWLQMGGEEGAGPRVGSAPPGTPARMRPRYFGDRRIEAGDQVNILIEELGPGGIWCEIGRNISLGKIPAELEEQFELAKEAQKVTLNLLKPGADPITIWDANNEFLRSKGYPEERRLYAHGQGYDMVERPCLMPGETIKIQAGMNLAVHPEVNSAKAHGGVCDNYIISEEGEPVCLHKTPQKIFVI